MEVATSNNISPSTDYVKMVLLYEEHIFNGIEYIRVMMVNQPFPIGELMRLSDALVKYPKDEWEWVSVMEVN